MTGIAPPISADWVFYLVALAIIVASLGVALIRNVIHAALALGGSFLGVAAYYVLLHAQFLAVAQVLVYVGDITVLILFALMLTRGIIGSQLERWGVPVASGAGIAVVLGGMIIYYLLEATQPGNNQFSAPNGAVSLQTALHSSYGIVQEFSRELLTVYLLPFEVASGILLMALVGAIVIAREEHP